MTNPSVFFHNPLVRTVFVLLTAHLALATAPPASNAGTAATSCRVVFRVTENVDLGAIRWNTDYTGAAGSFRGSADSAACSNLAGDLAAFNDKDGERELTIGVVSTSAPISGPTDLAECFFDATGSPQITDFEIEVTEATDPEREIVTPRPNVTIARIVCEDGSTTTTTSSSTTTSTVPSTTLGYALDCRIRFRATATTAIGQLQWTTDYAALIGQFARFGKEPECRALTDATFTSFSESRRNRTLTGTLLSLNGIDTPEDVVECQFATDVQPDEMNFGVEVTAWADADLSPFEPAPTLVVDNVFCIGRGSTTTLPTLSTTTTTLAEPEICEVRFEFDSRVALSSLQFVANAIGAPGNFLAGAGGADCVTNVAGFGAYTLDPSAKQVEGAVISLSPFGDEGTVATCRFKTNDHIGSGDIQVVATSAASGDAIPVLPLPTMSFTAVGCPARCGDGVTEQDEECDGGGQTASCNTDCTFSTCGDGKVNARAGEACDDGGESASCDTDCTLAVCGDRLINATAGEICDDGNLNDTDGCKSDCTPTQACGDHDGNGRLTASDALGILIAAVSQAECPLFVCDPNNDGQIVASDALTVLRAAIDPSVQLNCPLAPQARGSSGT